MWHKVKVQHSMGIGEISSLGTWRFIRLLPRVRSRSESGSRLDELIRKEVSKRVAELRG